MLKQELHVAMLEDDSDDRLLTKEVLADLDFKLKIDFYSSSEELFQSINSVQPHLILVDYNSTPQNGLEVLKRLKSTEAYRHIPIVILSDSQLSKYRKECYAAGANSFVIKPTSLAETKQKIKSFFAYWTEVAES